MATSSSNSGPMSVQDIINLVINWNDSASGVDLSSINSTGVERLREIQRLTTAAVNNKTERDYLTPLVHSLNTDWLLINLNRELARSDRDHQGFVERLDKLLDYAHLPLTNFLCDYIDRNPGAAQLFVWLMLNIPFYRGLNFLTPENTLQLLRCQNKSVFETALKNSAGFDPNPLFEQVISLTDFTDTDEQLRQVLNHPRFDLLEYLRGAAYSNEFARSPIVQATRDVLNYLDKIEKKSDNSSPTADAKSSASEEQPRSSSPVNKAPYIIRKLADMASESGVSFQYQETVFAHNKFVRAYLEELRQDYECKVKHTAAGQDNHRMIIKRDFLASVLDRIDVLCAGEQIDLSEIFKTTYIPWYIKQTGHEAAKEAVDKIIKEKREAAKEKAGEVVVTSENKAAEEEPEYSVEEYAALTEPEVLRILANSKVTGKRKTPFQWWLSEVFQGKALATAISHLTHSFRLALLLSSEESLPGSAQGLLSLDGRLVEDVRRPSIGDSTSAALFARVSTITSTDSNDADIQAGLIKNKIIDLKRRYKDSVVQGTQKRGSFSGFAGKVLKAASKVADHGRREQLKIGILQYLEDNLETLRDRVEGWCPEKPPLIPIFLEYVSQKASHEAEGKDVYKSKFTVLQEKYSKQKADEQLHEVNSSAWMSNVTLEDFIEVFAHSDKPAKRQDPLNALAHEALEGNQLKALLADVRDFHRSALEILFHGVDIDLDTFEVTVGSSPTAAARK